MLDIPSNSVTIHPSVKQKEIFMTTTNYTFPCDTVKGLTLAQKREAVKALKASIAESVAIRRESKALVKVVRAEKAEARRVAAIAKAKAKLDKLMAPVGAKATKANKRPSKPVVWNTKVAA
jgi:hypothetical protein